MSIPLAPAKLLLEKSGICEIPSLFTDEELHTINNAIDPLLSSRQHQKRSYIHADELHDLDILSNVLSPKVISLLRSVVSDPVLYHLHVYEIEGEQTKPHIFSDSLNGWHRDHDSEFIKDELTHVSLFVYLSAVTSIDGPFEFVPSLPTKLLTRNTNYISVTGHEGASFLWQRSFYHRASPNRGPSRRRVLKISVQNERFASAHLANQHFQRLMLIFPAGDTEINSLLGRNKWKNSSEQPMTHLARSIQPHGALGVKTHRLVLEQLRDYARSLKRRLTRPQIAAYD